MSNVEDVCTCYRCIVENNIKMYGLPLYMTRIIYCPKCGNKRCPHATDHVNPCTNSNELGQRGSRY